MRRGDRELYRTAVAGLSARSRYLRFAAPLPRLSESLLDQMMSFDGARHVAYAAFTPGERSIVGVARFVARPAPRPSAEVAIAVADDWQGAGLGPVLLARLVERARRTGLQRLTATTLGENRIAGRLARASGFSFVRCAGIYAEYELLLAGGAPVARRAAPDYDGADVPPRCDA
jgi:acetyltransferase